MADKYLGDLGTQLDIAGPAGSSGLTTTYRGGSLMYLGRAKRLVIDADIEFHGGGGAVTSIELRVVGRYDSTREWKPLQSSLQSEDPEETAGEHSFAAAGGNREETFITESLTGVNEIRIEAKHTGGTSDSSDKVVCKVRFV